MFVTKSIRKGFPILRHEGWEEILEPLVRKITGAQQGKVRSGCNHNNEVFFIKMHFVGTCPCGYSVKLKEFSSKNCHSLECFHTNWVDIDQTFRKHPLYSKALILKTERINMEMQLCRRYGVSYIGGKHIENICTCSYKKKWEKLGIHHEDDCPEITPNFHYKESDLKIWWNKKFFRDSYSNQEIQKNDFQVMIKNCINSI